MTQGDDLRGLDVPAIALWLLLACASCALYAMPSAADAQDDVHQQLQARWYVTELILFAYDRPMAAGESALLSGAEQADRVGAILQAQAEARKAELTGAIDALRVPSESASNNTDDASAADLTLFEFSAELDNGAIYRENLDRFEESLEALELAWLPAEDLTLADSAVAIERRGNGEVLLHGAWLQAVPERGAPVPQSIAAGPAFFALGDEHHQLEGKIDVTLGRYLHVRPALYFHAGLSQEQIDRFDFDARRSADVPIGRRASTASVEVRDLSSVARPVGVQSRGALADQMQAGDADTAGALPDAAGEALPAYYRMNQSRRVRSGELHYIDHPAFGILVQVTPVAIPQMLIDQFEALEAEAG
ncbi:MAG: CsiV family protein [Pseudomonadota bacterium]